MWGKAYGSRVRSKRCDQWDWIESVEGYGVTDVRDVKELRVNFKNWERNYTVMVVGLRDIIYKNFSESRYCLSQRVLRREVESRPRGIESGPMSTWALWGGRTKRVCKDRRGLNEPLNVMGEGKLYSPDKSDQRIRKKKEWEIENWVDV